MPGVIEKSGASLSTRKHLFYMVCVPLRLGIALGVYKFRSSRISLLILSAVSCTSLFLKLGESGVWWDRKFHFFSSALVTIFAIYNRLGFASLTIFLDVLYGLFFSWTRNGFAKKIVV